MCRLRSLRLRLVERHADQRGERDRGDDGE